MRYGIGVAASAVIIGLLFGFQVLMSRRLAVWNALNVPLTGSQKVMAAAAGFISAYWYLLLPVIVVVCVVASSAALRDDAPRR